MGAPLAYSDVARVLRVVAADQRTNHRALYSYQLLPRIDTPVVQ